MPRATNASMELTERYPLNVYYPYGGEHWILEWHVPWLQSSVVVARSFKSLIKGWEAVLSKHNAAPEARALYHAQIFAPNRKMEEAHAIGHFMNDRLNFLLHFTYMVDAYREKNKELPPGVVKCDRWREPKPHEMDEFSYQQRFEKLGERQFHDDGKCRVYKWEVPSLRAHCIGGYQIEGVKPLDAVDRMMVVKHPADEERCFPDSPKRMKSRAPRLPEGTPYYRIDANHGHHAKGNEIIFEETGDVKNVGDNTLFIFTGTKLETLPSEITAPLKALEDKRVEESRLREEKSVKYREDYDAMEKAHFANVLKAGRG